MAAGKRMNLNINVTPGTARRLCYVAATLLISGAATAAFAVPVRFVSQQKLTAAQLNQNFAAVDAKLATVTAALELLSARVDAPIVTTWIAYTPELSTDRNAPVLRQTTTGFYRRVGDSIEVRVVTLFTAAPASGAKGWRWSLPKGLAIDLTKTTPDNAVTIGTGLAQQNPSNIVLNCYVVDTNSISAIPHGNLTYRINDDLPFSFAEGSSISLFFSVPIEGWTATR
jgi:hypothetical protein